RNPPIGGVSGIALFDEEHSGKFRRIEHLSFPEMIVVVRLVRFVASTLHRLENKKVFGHMLMDQVQSQKRMPQVVKHAHEEDQIELLAQVRDVVNRQLPKLN